MLDDERRRLRERLRTLPIDGTYAERARRLRSLLEEMGIHCDETAELQDADAVLLASGRGADAMIAARLSDEERFYAYARLVARLLIGHMHAPIDAKIEYEQPTGSKQEREEDKTVMTFADALVEGELARAPRPIYEDVPRFTLAFTPRTAVRSTLGGFHLWSDFWYKRSDMYRRWRSRRGVSKAIDRIVVVMNERGAAASG
jgi:hypothetical protein